MFTQLWPQRAISELTQETWFNYLNIYLLLCCSSRREKWREYGNMRRPHQFDKEKQHIPMKKRCANNYLEIFPSSNMLVCRVTYWITPFLERTPKIRAGKLSYPYVFVSGVQLYVFILSHLSVNSQKDTSGSLTSACRVGGTYIHFRRLR